MGFNMVLERERQMRHQQCGCWGALVIAAQRFHFQKKESRMNKPVLWGMSFVVLAASAASAGVIDDRQAIMKSFAQANTILVGLSKAYDPQIEYAQLKVLSEGAGKLGALFPAGS